MGTLVRAVLAVLLLVAGCGRPALAAITVEGEGYRFRLPDGFRAHLTAGGREGPGIGGLLGQGATAQFRVFVRGPTEAPTASITVVFLEAGTPVRDLFGTEPDLSQVEAVFRQKLGQGAAEAGIEVRHLGRTFIGGGQEAVEVVLAQAPSLGAERLVRMAVTVRAKQVLMLMMEAPDGVAADDQVWREALLSLRLQGPSFLMLARRYGPYVLGALLLVVLLVLKGRSSSRRLADPLLVAAATSPGAAAGLSRAADGLPLYGAPSPAAPAAARPSRGALRAASGPAAHVAATSAPPPLPACAASPAPGPSSKVKPLPRAVAWAEGAPPPVPGVPAGPRPPAANGPRPLPRAGARGPAGEGPPSSPRPAGVPGPATDALPVPGPTLLAEGQALVSKPTNVAQRLARARAGGEVGGDASPGA